MADNDFTATEVPNKKQHRHRFYLELIDEIYDIAAMVDSARALAQELDDGVNVNVSRSLRLVLQSLNGLAERVDDYSVDDKD